MQALHKNCFLIIKFILAVENFFTPVTFETCALSITFQLMSSTEKWSTWWWLVTLFTLEWHSCWLFLKSSSHSSLFKCFQSLRVPSCWNFNQFFNNSAFFYFSPLCVFKCLLISHELLCSSKYCDWIYYLCPQHSPLSLIHIWRCRRSTLCRSRWSPYH